MTVVETRQRVRFQAPCPPPLEAIAPYYRLSEDARWFANGGPCALLLQERIAARIGGGIEVVLVSNATAGLLAALRATAGSPGPGNRLVALPSFTFVATADAVVWAGFEPVFVDVDPRTWHLDPAALADALAARGAEFAAVLACSTFGTPAAATDRAGVEGLAAAHGIPVVVDAAAAFGATDDRGEVAGRTGHAEVYSFHATKPFAVGEGGCVTTTSPAVAERLRAAVNFGFEADRSVHVPGLNAKMSELHAACGLAVDDGYDAVLAGRRLRAQIVRDALEPAGWSFQQGSERSTVQFIPALAPDAATRARALHLGAARGIELRTYFDPSLHALPAFATADRGPLPITEDLQARCLSLPMADDIGDDALAAVIACCLDA